jgi:hypothetical protein
MARAAPKLLPDQRATPGQTCPVPIASGQEYDAPDWLHNRIRRRDVGSTRLLETYTAAFDAGRGCQRFAHSKAVAAAPDPDWRCTHGGGLGRFGREVDVPRAEWDGQIG